METYEMTDEEKDLDKRGAEVARVLRLLDYPLEEIDSEYK